MLKLRLQHFTLAEETTRNEHNVTKRKVVLLLKSAAFREQVSVQKTLQNDPPEIRCFVRNSGDLRNTAGRKGRHQNPLTDHATQPCILAAFHFHQATKKSASTATLNNRELIRLR